MLFELFSGDNYDNSMHFGATIQPPQAKVRIVSAKCVLISLEHSAEMAVAGAGGGNRLQVVANARERPSGLACEKCIHNATVLLGKDRAGRIDEVPSGGNARRCGSQQLCLKARLVGDALGRPAPGEPAAGGADAPAEEGRWREERGDTVRSEE